MSGSDFGNDPSVLNIVSDADPSTELCDYVEVNSLGTELTCLLKSNITLQPGKFLGRVVRSGGDSVSDTLVEISPSPIVNATNKIVATTGILEIKGLYFAPDGVSNIVELYDLSSRKRAHLGKCEVLKAYTTLDDPLLTNPGNLSITLADTLLCQLPPGLAPTSNLMATVSVFGGVSPTVTVANLVPGTFKHHICF